MLHIVKMASSLSAFLFSVLFFAVARADEAQLTKEEFREKQSEVQLECSQIHNVPQNYIQLLLLGEATESKNGKCFIKCGMNGMGYLNADGSLNQDNIKQSTWTYFDDENSRQLAIDTWLKCDNQCHSQSYSDSSCDRAFELAKCFYNQLKETGMNINKPGQQEQQATSE